MFNIETRVEVFHNLERIRGVQITRNPSADAGKYKYVEKKQPFMKILSFCRSFSVYQSATAIAQRASHAGNPVLPGNAFLGIHSWAHLSPTPWRASESLPGEIPQILSLGSP